MACNCTGTEQDCIKVYVNPCDTGIPLGVTAPSDGEYVILLTGGLAARRFAFQMESGEEIVLPNEINNNFVFQMQIFAPNGDLLNDTCYILKTNVSLSGTNNIPPSPAPVAYTFITVTEDDISNDGDTLTYFWFLNHTVIELVTSNQAYILGADFTQSGGTITWINGNKFYDGQIILAQS